MHKVIVMAVWLMVATGSGQAGLALGQPSTPSTGTPLGVEARGLFQTRDPLSLTWDDPVSVPVGSPVEASTCNCGGGWPPDDLIQ